MTTASMTFGFSERRRGSHRRPPSFKPLWGRIARSLRQFGKVLSMQRRVGVEDESPRCRAWTTRD